MSHLLAFESLESIHCFERTILQAVILAENVVCAFLRLAEQRAVNFLKPAQNQKY